MPIAEERGSSQINKMPVVSSEPQTGVVAEVTLRQLGNGQIDFNTGELSTKFYFHCVKKIVADIGRKCITRAANFL